MKWIWFDLDDTVYDFAASSLIGLEKIHAKYSLGRYFPVLQDWIDCYHRHNHDLWDLYNRGLTDQLTLRRERFVRPLREGGVPEDEIARMWPGQDVDYLDFLAETGMLVEGAREVIDRLHAAGYRIGILSNGFVGVQNAKLRSARLESVIDCLVLSDEIGINKPDRRLFDYALQKAGTTADRSIMVGDNPDTDIAGAVAAGWSAILFDRKGTAASYAHESSAPVIPDGAAAESYINIYGANIPVVTRLTDILPLLDPGCVDPRH